MRIGILNTNKGFEVEAPVKMVLSFRPFFHTIKTRLNGETTIKSEFHKFVLKRFETEVEMCIDLAIEDTSKYSDLMEFIYATVSPLLTEEESSYWALGTAVPNKVFYGTNSFYSLFPNCCSVDSTHGCETPLDIYKRHQTEFVYRLILESVYKFPAFSKNQIVYSYSCPETGLMKYYRVNIDTQFINIRVSGELPTLDFNVIEPYLYEGAGIDLLKNILPLDIFTFEGFSIVSLEDITPEQTIENIRSALTTNSSNEGDLYRSVINSLKTLVEDNTIEFGLLPFLMINERVVFNTSVCSNSILIRSAIDQNAANEHFSTLVNEYLQTPKAIFFNEISSDKLKEYNFLKVIKTAGIQSYAVLPVFFNQRLAGILEVYSTTGNIFFEKLLSRLDQVIPFIAQLLQHSVEDFNAKIENVIKEKFTSLQPAVQWKFNEVAWKYLMRRSEDQKIETVTFKNVHPLYGAVDIRNSTIERNRALQEDIRINLTILIETLIKLKRLIHLDLTDELIFKAEKWLSKILDPLTPNDEITLNYFLEREVTPFLTHFKDNKPEVEQTIGKYLEAVDDETGSAFANRRNLEVSMQMINSVISQYFENVQDELQSPYPCYFEKFRTDGIEYDIYVGQSIAPTKPFNTLFLKNLRLWQLKAMIEISKLTHSVLLKMPRPLQTTQLIFVHGSTIDISFRNDERRFDVEGAYNIRYEVIKKRIDKVTIKDTAERLTQPGKIALVYFDRKEADEYLRYIQYMQEQNLLDDDLEFLDLDELQGVTGLKAFRVGVNFGDELIDKSSYQAPLFNQH